MLERKTERTEWAHEQWTIILFRCCIVFLFRFHYYWCCFVKHTINFSDWQIAFYLRYASDIIHFTSYFSLYITWSLGKFVFSSSHSENDVWPRAFPFSSDEFMRMKVSTNICTSVLPLLFPCLSYWPLDECRLSRWDNEKATWKTRT